MDKNTCHCRGAPSRPLTTAADGKTASGPGTETGSGNRAGTVTERGSGREKEREKGRGKEGGRERESMIGHQTNRWTHTLRYLFTRDLSLCLFADHDPENSLSPTHQYVIKPNQPLSVSHECIIK